MELKDIAKQTFDFYRSSFNNSFNAIMMLQEQAQKVLDMYLEQTTGFPEEGKKAVNEWIKAYKKGSTDFKGAVDESFKRIEGFFVEPAKSSKK